MGVFLAMVRDWTCVAMTEKEPSFLTLILSFYIYVSYKLSIVAKPERLPSYMSLIVILMIVHVAMMENIS